MEIVLNENEIAKRETIDLSKTFVNMFYGRTVIPANLKKIKAKFDFNKLGVIIVHKNAYDDEAYRNLKTINGAVLDYDPTVNVYEIIDGNHRVTALQDLLNADEMLVGGGDINFWTNLFKKCYNKPINILTMSVEELILIKYFRNSFLATKVSFFNQIYDLCEATGIDYKNVKEGIGMDTRIGNSHTDVNTSRGYGGHCFPKDVQAILETAQANNVDLSLIKQSQQYNNTVRKEI